MPTTSAVPRIRIGFTSANARNKPMPDYSPRIVAAAVSIRGTTMRSVVNKVVPAIPRSAPSINRPAADSQTLWVLGICGGIVFGVWSNDSMMKEDSDANGMAHFDLCSAVSRGSHVRVCFDGVLVRAVLGG